MAGNFRGSQFSWFLRLTGDPRKLNPRNKKPVLETSTRACTHNNRGRGYHGACRCWIDLIAGLFHTSSLLSFFYTKFNVSSLDHMRLSCHFLISTKYKCDKSATEHIQ